MTDDLRAKGTILLGVLAGICVGVSWLMYLVHWFFAGIGAGANDTFVSVSVAAFYWT